MKNLFFYFHGNCAKFVQPIAIFLAYLIQLHVDVTGNITAVTSAIALQWQF
jgi:hypothetical protein